jgi:hypothetical protein
MSIMGVRESSSVGFLDEPGVSLLFFLCPHFMLNQLLLKLPGRESFAEASCEESPLEPPLTEVFVESCAETEPEPPSARCDGFDRIGFVNPLPGALGGALLGASSFAITGELGGWDRVGVDGDGVPIVPDSLRSGDTLPSASSSATGLVGASTTTGGIDCGGITVAV